MSASHLTLEQIVAVKNDISSMYKLMYQLEEQVKNVRNLIENKKHFLITHCKHDRQIDINARSEHTEFYCSICGMYL